MSLQTAGRHSRVAAAVAAALGVAVAQAETPLPDTSSWKCEQCPFFQGYAAASEAGVVYADGANASYGRYTGIDHNGAYLDASARGQSRSGTGTYTEYDLQHLGLPSRDGYVEAGKEGRYGVRLSYDGQPTRLYDTASTPFQSAGAGQLTLPSNWVAANSTAAMTQLGQSLTPVKIEYNRRTVSLFSDFFAGPNWTIYGDFRHQEKNGTGLTGGSFLTEAAQLPQPIDFATNSFEAGVRWAGRVASLRLTYSGSWFQDNSNSLTWANPYLPVVPGSVEGRLALSPNNNLQQVSASGEVRLPIFAATILTYTASVGRMRQDTPFLPVSILSGSPTLARGSLDGDVRTSHYVIALASRPMSKLYVRGTASYDGRDDRTPTFSIPYVVTDTLPGGTFVAPRYGQDRLRLDGSADYRLFKWVRVGVGGEYLNVQYAPGQAVTYTEENRSWGHLTLNPLSSVSLVLKAGNGRRGASSINTAQLPANENPLLRAYNFAPRDQNFFSVNGSWTLTSTLTWALEGSWADDAYRLTGLGLQDGRDRRISTTVTWVPTEKLNFYANGGYQRMSALQNGASAPGAAVWQVRDAEYFWTSGIGGQWVIRDRWDLGLDYVHASTRGDTTVFLGGPGQGFPQNRSALDSVWLSSTYRWSPALRVHLRYGHEKYDTRDWALDNVGPATVPNLLALGVQPYRHAVNVVGLTMQYQFGGK
jgi:MtrB/PioB family decaheme-associated outer membrane protein